MRRKKSLFLVPAISLLFSISGFAKTELSVWPNKILYEPGETAKFEVSIKNDGKEPLKGILKVSTIWEIEDSEKVYEKEIEIPPGEKKGVTVPWDTREVLGCEVKAEVVINGETVASSSEYFNVIEGKDAQRVGIHVEYPDLFTYSNEKYLSTVPGKILSLRCAYGNIMEHFGWCPDNFAELTPEGDEWASNYWQSKAAIKKSIEEAHENGMKVLHYAAGYTWAMPGMELIRRHPEWALYNSTGQLNFGGTLDVKKLDFDKNPVQGKSVGGGAQGGRLNFTLKDPLDHGIEELIGTRKMFGWDGVRFDGHYTVYSGSSVYDVNGDPTPPPEEAETLTMENTAYTKKKVLEVFPDHLFMFNTGVYNPDTGRVRPDIKAICPGGGAAAVESVNFTYATNSRWHTWKNFATLLVTNRGYCHEYGGYAYAYLNPPWKVVPNVDKIQYPILFATRNHPWFAFPALDRHSDKGGSHYPIQKDLFRFATRYSAILWGYETERIEKPQDMIKVTAEEGNLWWEMFTYLRKLKDGRNFLIVHLINEPPTQNIEPEHQPLPEPIRDILVSVKPEVKKAWVLSSGPPMKSSELSRSESGFILPELKIWSIFVAEIASKIG